MKQLFYILSALCIAALAACSDFNQDSEPQLEFRYDMVTYNGYSNGIAEFDNIYRNDSRTVTLRGQWAKKPDLESGARVLLSYLNQGQETTLECKALQNISINSISKATTDTLRMANKARIDTLRKDDIRLLSLWRTGNYINLQGEVEHTGKPRFFYLLMDKATADNDTVDCYLINDPLDNTIYYWRRFYASFYVGAAFNKQSCKTLRIIINDAKSPNRHDFCFTKE